MILIIVPLLSLMTIILTHEWGHFIVAKFHNVRVDEFAIGMGHKLIAIGNNGLEILWFGRGKKKVEKDGKVTYKKTMIPLTTKVISKPKFCENMETTYSIRLLPLGGFCNLFGMDDKDSDNPRAFSSKKNREKIAIVMAGSFMNIVLAFIIFVSLLVTDISFTTTISDMTPAMKDLGIKNGDVIVGVEGKNIETIDEYLYHLTLALRNTKESDITLSVRRGSQKHTYTVPKKNFENTTGFGFKKDTNKNPFHILKNGIFKVFANFKITFDSFGKLAEGEVSANEMSGIIGIFKIFIDSFKTGLSKGFIYAFKNVIYLTGIISLNIGLMNLLPIPVLDGGHIARYSIESVTKTKLSPRVANALAFIGIFFLGSLTVFFMFNDLKKILLP